MKYYFLKVKVEIKLKVRVQIFGKYLVVQICIVIYILVRLKLMEIIRQDIHDTLKSISIVDLRFSMSRQRTVGGLPHYTDAAIYSLPIILEIAVYYLWSNFQCSIS